MTTPAWFFGLLDAAIIGCAMVSGFFLTFSDFLMRSLRLAKTDSGIQVMQLINREVLRSVTIVMLWGMLGLSLALTGTALLNRVSGLPFVLISSACALYFFGVLVVSFARNLPMNAELDAMDCRAAASARYWEDTYLSRWVFWNTVRAIASGGASACLLAATMLLMHSAG